MFAVGKLGQFSEIDVQFYSARQTTHLVSLRVLPCHIIDMSERETLVYRQLLGQMDEPILEHDFEHLFFILRMFYHVLAPVFVNGAHEMPHIEVVDHLQGSGIVPILHYKFQQVLALQFVALFERNRSRENV